MKYGGEPDEWEALARAGVEFLTERARLRKTTSYTEMNAVLARRTGLREFDFQEQSERAAMGYLLGLILNETLPDLGFMLTALVNYLDANDAGPGFYAFAQEKALLRRGASKIERDEFWVRQMNAAYGHFAS